MAAGRCDRQKCIDHQLQEVVVDKGRRAWEAQ
jgi:hypothetical protein